MALLDLFKKSKTSAKKTRAVTAEKERKERPKISSAARSYENYLILKKPLITERATLLAESHKYLFEVAKNANKKEIKKAIEGVWPVTVERVHIVNLPAKKIRLGRSIGEKGGRKKAIVTLQEGHSIELLPK